MCAEDSVGTREEAQVRPIKEIQDELARFLRGAEARSPRWRAFPDVIDFHRAQEAEDKAINQVVAMYEQGLADKPEAKVPMVRAQTAIQRAIVQTELVRERTKRRKAEVPGYSEALTTVEAGWTDLTRAYQDEGKLEPEAVATQDLEIILDSITRISQASQ